MIVELEQWETAESTSMDGVVRTFLGGGVRDTAHPSYQAWSYAELLRGFDEAVEFKMIDDQKLVFERAMHLVRSTPAG